MVPKADWFEREGLAAIHRRGTLRHREEVVPENVKAFSLSEPARRYESGELLAETAMLVSSGPVSLSLDFVDLRDTHGTPGDLHLELQIDTPNTLTAAKLFQSELFSSDDELPRSKLADKLADLLRLDVARLARSKPWDGVAGVLEVLRSDALVDRLEEPLFEMGLELKRVVMVRVESEALLEARTREFEMTTEAERIRQRIDFIELWKRAELGEALARHEVERVSAHLRRQGVLRDRDAARLDQERASEALAEESRERAKLRRILERERIETRAAVDEANLEHEIARAKKLEATFGDIGIPASIAGLDDVAARERLLRLLIQREMTPEQIEAESSIQVIRDLERQVESLRSGSDAPRWSHELSSMDSIWLAAGLAIYRVPGTGLDDASAARPVLPSQDLGYLRSVSTCSTGKDVLVGGQNGVGVYHSADSSWTTLDYEKPGLSRRGANSVFSAARGVLASHSEHGLTWWPNDGLRPVGLHRGVVRPGRSTRGLQMGPGGRLYFAHGNTVMSIDGSDPESAPIIYGELDASVTALGCDAHSVMVGTREGALFCVRPNERPRRLDYRAPGPVFSIAPVAGGDQPRWAIGARLPAVHIVDGDGRSLCEFRSRYPIRWVGAGREGVLGVDRFGLNLLVWRWDQTSAPVVRIRVPDQIQSIAIVRRREERTER